jgi:hypothetical protein
MLQITSTNEEKVPVSIAPLTAAGNPAAVENVNWVVTEGDATVVVVDANNVEFVSGTGGLTKVTVTADADLGEGVVTLTDEVEYFVVAAQATTFGFTAGAPVLK